MKVDIFSHMIPQKYKDALLKKSKINTSEPGKVAGVKSCASVKSKSGYDVSTDIRSCSRFSFRLLHRWRPLYRPADAPELAKINNDETSELVSKYPDKFMAGVALLPLHDIDAAQKEAERGCMKMGLRGIIMNPVINGEPMDLPKFKPLYAQMAQYDLPIWIHPSYSPAIHTSQTSGMGEMAINKFLNWPAETSLAMLRLVNSGIFKEFPKIKFITHHCGGLIPFCGDQIKLRDDDLHNFYCDTALFHTAAPLMCGYAFFGPDHLVFGTDTNEGRPHHGVTWDAIRALEQLDIPDIDKEKIFARNASRLLRTGL